MTRDLFEYVLSHTERGECKCGLCADKGDKPDPTGHTVDMVFFKAVATNNPSLEEFKRLTESSKHGEFCDCDPFDGSEHSYLELGGWIGDQGTALLYMALGTILGAFHLMTPKAKRGPRPIKSQAEILAIDSEMAMKLAQSGLITVSAKPVPRDFTGQVLAFLDEKEVV